MDISWVAERTNYWDAVGVAAYGLMFALFESLMVWGVMILMGFLLPRSWSESKRTVLLGIFILVIALWAMFGQLYFMLEWSFPESIIQFLVRQAHPLRLLYAGYLAVIAFTVVLAAYFAVFSGKFERAIITIIERLSTLMGLYVFLDVISIVIVLIRNIG